MTHTTYIIPLNLGSNVEVCQRNGLVRMGGTKKKVKAQGGH